MMRLNDLAIGTWAALFVVAGCGGRDSGSNPATPTSPTGAVQANYVCTLVIGFSQTRQWYTDASVFESIVGDHRWELKWAGGAGVNRWRDPNDRAWNAPILSPCTDRSGDPDRVFLSVSGGFGADKNAWTDAIEDTLALIRSRFPSTRSIVLIPVVAGPNHQDCPIDGGRVRASWQHAHIDNAIQMVVAGDGVGNLVAGFSPEVRTCDDYRDRLGHLTDSGAEAAGRAIGNFYRGS